MSKKGRLKIEHLSLKGAQSKNTSDHSIIIITSEWMHHYNVVKQTILKQPQNNNEESIRLQALLDTFIAAKCLRQQIESFKRLLTLNWSDDVIPSQIGSSLLKLALSLTTSSLNKDFIKILCRLLDKLHLCNTKEFDYSTLVPILDAMVDDPQFYHVATLNKLLSCCFMQNCTDSITIWRILKLLTTLLNALLLNNNYKQQRLCLLGRDIIGAFWLFLTNNGIAISSLFQSEPHPTIIANLFHTCHQLLCIASFHKDVITKVAFLYHLLITYVLTDDKQQTQCFTRITHAIQNANKTETNTLLIESSSTVTSISADWNKTCFLSKIGFVRAIISQSHIRVLEFELMDTCYDVIMNDWCVQTQTTTNNTVATLYLFDTICAWIATNYNILTTTTTTTTCTTDYVKRLHPKLECIYRLMERNWDHPSRAVTFVIETMYTKYIQIMDEIGTEEIGWMKHVEHAMSLSVGEHGKYLRLKVLMKRVGALTLFEKYPNWIMMLLEASCVVGGTAMNLVHESLNVAKHDLMDVTKWRALWLDAMCKGFVHPNDAVRSATNTDLLKYVIGADPTSYFPLIEHILQLRDINIRSLIGILRSGKRNGIITNERMEEWLNEDEDSEEGSFINRDLIFSCLLHEDLKIRMETLDLICASKWSTDIPGTHQLQILQSILPYLMCMQMSKMRDQFVRMIQKLMLRIKNGCYKILHIAHKRIKSCASRDIFAALDSANQNCIINGLDFIEWFRSFLLNNLYPSAPMERVTTAITLYYFILKIWTDKKQNETEYDMLQIPLLSTDVYLVDILLNCMMNSRDQVRLLSAKILKLLPSPLPGYETKASVIGLVQRCLILSTSPRLLESDCGAFMLALLFDKYTKRNHHWSFDLCTIFMINDNDYNTTTIRVIHEHKNEQEAMLSFLSSFNEILNKHIASISILPFHERYRSPHHRVHGLLTFFREMISNFDFTLHSKAKWKAIFSNILQNIFEIGEMSLILHTRNPKQKEIENTNVNCDGLIGIDCRGHMIFDSYIDQQNEQMIVVSSWLAIKESCLCLAKFIQNCPLPTKQNEDASMVQIRDIHKIGAFFIRTLQTTRHNGVIEKSHAGFTILCRTLLGSGVAIIRDMVREWLEQLLNMVRMDAAQHWIRRSAGFPFSLLAILEAESKVSGNDQTLFMYTIQSLLTEAQKEDDWQSKVVALNVIMFIFRNAAFNLSVMSFISEAFRIVLPGFAHKQWAVRNSSMLCLSAILSRAIRRKPSDHCNNGNGMNDDLLNLKAYIDKNNETHEFFESGLLLDVAEIYNGSSSSSSPQKRKKIKGTTAEIFFNQNPDLHSYLLQHLNDATKDDSNMHPSLFPVLLLLSKLTARDGNNNNNNNNGLSLSVFKCNVIKCSSHQYQRVRMMSARALTCLIAKNELISFLGELIAQLPSCNDQEMSMNGLHGLLLQIQYISRECYYLSDRLWIIDVIVPILIDKLWILNSNKIAAIVQQTLIIICISLLHRILAIINNNNNNKISLSTKQWGTVTLFLMRIYKCGLTVLSTNSESKNDIHKTYSEDDNDDDACDDDIKLIEIDIGTRRLRSFTAKILIESLLLSPHCSMMKADVTQLICVMLKDSDELVVQSTANCLCCVINNAHAYNICKDKMDWRQILSICMNLMKWSLWLKRRLASIIQLFESLIGIRNECEEMVSGNPSLWNVTYQIALHNCHFVVQIAAMQCLGTMIHILLNKKGEIISPILKNWIAILDKLSREDTPEELRSVCVSSIQASQILLSPQFTNEVIDIWLIMIRLLQDFELPIRNNASKSVSSILLKSPVSAAVVSNYCIYLVFNYLSSDRFMLQSTILLKKVLPFIIDPDVQFYTKWMDDVDASAAAEFKLFLPERPNDSFEPLLTMQMATNLFLQHVATMDPDTCVLNFINVNVINNILSDMQHINEMIHDTKKENTIMDAQMQLICTIWMIHWFSLFYCYQIISSSSSTSTRRYKLCTFVMNKLKSRLDALKQKTHSNIITTFCQRHLQRAQNSNDVSKSAFFLL